MNYLYHMVPDKMKGNFLIPLNALKKKYPSAYREEVKKYKGRESILKIKVPILNCLWNDVIHMTSVNPKDLKKALDDAGRSKDSQKMKFFRINSSELDNKSIILFLYSHQGKISNKEDYTAFKPSNLKKYAKIPSKTKKYFKESYLKRERPLMFHLVPHILYKGKINIKNCKIIEV